MNAMLENSTTAMGDRWHELLSTRYVCEMCLTRYFVPYEFCKACRTEGRIVPLIKNIELWATDDEQLRDIIAHRRRPWEEAAAEVNSQPLATYEI